jgi:hypothetical protein
MALRKVNTMLLQQIKIDRERLSKTATSTTHVMSREDYLSIYEKLFDYASVQVSYNKEITNEEEQVVVVIGI